MENVNESKNNDKKRIARFIEKHPAITWFVIVEVLSIIMGIIITHDFWDFKEVFKFMLMLDAVVAFFIVIGSCANEIQEECKAAKAEAETRRIKTNPTYAYSRKIYAFAPSADGYINRIYNSTVRSALGDSGNIYEAKAVQNEVIARKDETPYEIELSSKQSILNYLNEMLVTPVRPEVIGMVLINNLDKHFNLSDDLVKVKIEACLKEFDKTYKYWIDEMKGRQRLVVNLERDSYNNSEPSVGLGFGIITSSPSKALLFAAMDNYEKEKQEKLKWAKYTSNMTRETGAAVEGVERQISKLYKELLYNLRIVIKQGI